MMNGTRAPSRRELAAEIQILKRDRDRLHQLLATDRQTLQQVCDYLEFSADFTVTQPYRLNKAGVLVASWSSPQDMAPPPSLEYLMSTPMSSAVFT